MVDVSIIVLNHNGRRFLTECLSTVLNQRCSKTYEVILVDNASADDSVPFVKEKFASHLRRGVLRIVQSGKNLGFAGGNNLGVRRAKGRICVLVNNDVRVYAGWPEELIRPLGEGAMMVGCNNRGPNSQGKGWSHMYGKERVVETMNLVGGSIYRNRLASEDPYVSPFFIGGVCLAFRKKDIPKPFDDAYFAYAEDVALGWRLRLEGEDLAINPKSHLFHYGGSTKHSTTRLRRFATFHGCKNSIMNHFVHFEMLNVLRVLPILLFYEALLVLGRPLEIPFRLKGYWWVVANARTIRKLRRKVQSKRSVPDRNLLAMVSARLFETRYSSEPGVLRTAQSFCNGLVLAYAFLTAIPCYERTRL